MNTCYALARHPLGRRSLMTLPLAGVVLLLMLTAGPAGLVPVAAAPPPPAKGADERLAGPYAPGPLASRPQTTPAQDFEDVPTSASYYAYLHNIYNVGIVSGYDCGGMGEPCVPPANLPYYRPTSLVTRAQMSKFIDQGRHLPGMFINGGMDAFPFYSESDAPSSTGVYGNSNGGGPNRTFSEVSSGVHAYASGPSNSVGLLVESNSDNGAWITTYDPSGGPEYYGLSVLRGGAEINQGGSGNSTALNVQGNLIVSGSKTGYVVDLMRNSGTSDLHPGEVAALGAQAAAAAQLGSIPVPNVERAGVAYDSGVLGIVDQLWLPADLNAPTGTAQRTGMYDPSATVIRPGEYMSVVTLGAYRAVRVDATNGPIRVGDLLVSSAVPGTAMKADDKLVRVGTVIGKALDNLEAGTGTIPIMVTLK